MKHRPSAQVEIDAPIDIVWSVMVDTRSYSEWNPFVIRADCPMPPQPGDPILLHVRWADGKGTRSPERITVVDPPQVVSGVQTATLAYVYEGIASKLRLVMGTRFQRLIQAPGGPTTYTTFEEFSGPLVRLAGPERVADGFRRHAAALKQRAEAVALR